MKMNFLWLTITTTILWYLTIGFVCWDLTWIKSTANMTITNRMWFALGVILKIGVDLLVWSYIKTEPRKEEDQITYNENK